MHPLNLMKWMEDAWASYDNYEKSLTIELEGVDPLPHISTNNNNYKQLQQTVAENNYVTDERTRRFGSIPPHINQQTITITNNCDKQYVTDDKTRRCGSIPTYFKKQLHLQTITNYHKKIVTNNYVTDDKTWRCGSIPTYFPGFFLSSRHRWVGQFGESHLFVKN